MSTTGNILVIRLSSLGDVLMSIPAVKALRTRFPDSHITWLVEGSVGELLAHQGFIDEVIPFPRGPIQSALKRGQILRCLTEWRGFSRKLRDRHYDLVLDFHGIIKSALLGLCARGSNRVGFGKTFAKEQSHRFYNRTIDHREKRIHKVERNLLMARHFGSNGTVPDFSLTPSAAAEGKIEAFLREQDLVGALVAINPFSSKGSTFKRWGLASYAALAGRIRDELKSLVIVLWGPGEREEAEELARRAGSGVVPACPTTVPELYSLLTKVTMYVGGDTGVMHLATFASRPVVAIFGPTDHLVNAPFGGKAVVVRKDLSCSPCKKKDCRDRQCLETITVADVFNTVVDLWNREGLPA
jgi:heptosyltransferase I